MPSPHTDTADDESMSFGDHLEELRKRTLLALAAPLPLAIVTFFFTDTLIDWLLLPVFKALVDAGLPPQVQQLSPQEYLVTQLKLSVIAAIVLSAPWVLWQAWLFIRPGLYQHEKRFVHFLLPGSVILTVAGIALLYFIMLPLMMHFLVTIGANAATPAVQTLDSRLEPLLAQGSTITVLTQSPQNPRIGQLWVVWPDMSRIHAGVPGPDRKIEVLTFLAPSPGVQQNYRLSETLNLLLLMFLGIAIAFQMPLIVVLLGWLGLATPQWLGRQRKYALFICGILAAIITPTGDVVSMLFMLVPLYGLYELGILLLRIAPASRVARGTVLRRGPGDHQSPSE